MFEMRPAFCRSHGKTASGANTAENASRRAHLLLAEGGQTLRGSAGEVSFRAPERVRERAGRRAPEAQPEIPPKHGFAAKVAFETFLEECRDSSQEAGPERHRRDAQQEKRGQDAGPERATVLARCRKDKLQGHC